MSTEIARERANETRLRRCVWRLVDADLIMPADGEALLGCVSGAASDNAAPRAQCVDRLLVLLEALVGAGDLPSQDAELIFAAFGRTPFGPRMNDPAV